MPTVKDILADRSVTACTSVEIAKFIVIANFMRIDLDIIWRSFSPAQQEVILGDLKVILCQTFKPEIKPTTAWPKYTMINGVSHELNMVYLTQQTKLQQNAVFISRHNLAFSLAFYGTEYGSLGKRKSTQDSLLVNALHFVEFFTLLIALVRGFDIVHERCGLGENAKYVFAGVTKANPAIYVKLILADEQTLPIGYDLTAAYDILFPRFSDTFFSLPHTTELFLASRKIDQPKEFEYCKFAEYNKLLPRIVGGTFLVGTVHAQQKFLAILQNKCRDKILRDNLLIWIKAWQHSAAPTDHVVRRKLTFGQP